MHLVSKTQTAFEEDSEWLIENLATLRLHYAGEWVAVNNKTVILHNHNRSDLISQLEDPPHTVVEYINPADTITLWPY